MTTAAAPEHVCNTPPSAFAHFVWGGHLTAHVLMTPDKVDALVDGHIPELTRDLASSWQGRDRRRATLDTMLTKGPIDEADVTKERWSQYQMVIMEHVSYLAICKALPAGDDYGIFTSCIYPTGQSSGFARYNPVFVPVVDDGSAHTGPVLVLTYGRLSVQSSLLNESSFNRIVRTQRDRIGKMAPERREDVVAKCIATLNGIETSYGGLGISHATSPDVGTVVYVQFAILHGANRLPTAEKSCHLTEMVVPEPGGEPGGEPTFRILI